MDDKVKQIEWPSSPVKAAEWANYSSAPTTQEVEGEVSRVEGTEKEFGWARPHPGLWEW